MSFGIYFSGHTPAEALRQALRAVYGIPEELVYVGPYDGLNDHPGPDPIVLILPSGGQFGHELRAGDRLGELTGATELALAQALCRAAGTRALVSDSSPASSEWILVAQDGSYGTVEVDPDSEQLSVVSAFAPIAGAPDVPVVPPPDWYTWSPERGGR